VVDHDHVAVLDDLVVAVYDLETQVLDGGLHLPDVELGLQGAVPVGHAEGEGLGHLLVGVDGLVDGVPPLLHYVPVLDEVGVVDDIVLAEAVQEPGDVSEEVGALAGDGVAEVHGLLPRLVDEVAEEPGPALVGDELYLPPRLEDVGEPVDAVDLLAAPVGDLPEGVLVVLPLGVPAQPVPDPDEVVEDDYEEVGVEEPHVLVGEAQEPVALPLEVVGGADDVDAALLVDLGHDLPYGLLAVVLHLHGLAVVEVQDVDLVEVGAVQPGLLDDVLEEVVVPEAGDVVQLVEHLVPSVAWGAGADDHPFLL